MMATMTTITLYRAGGREGMGAVHALSGRIHPDIAANGTCRLHCGWYRAASDCFEGTAGEVTCGTCLKSQAPHRRLLKVKFSASIPADVDGDDLQMAADYIREHGSLPEWLVEPLARALAESVKRFG